ncbi:MAG: metallophosphoesterase [Oscillospiraceae bacterium]|jgi:diadenosine tetraphosphatase ApaH/serine/threonine PP2A family protein phosphatase|nr:metallophosphoesterase [Oscillospiraceae bacterium]
MKKKILSILLSTALISQIGMIPQTSAVYAGGGRRNVVQCTQSGDESRLSRVLPWVIGGTLTAAAGIVLHGLYHSRPDPAKPVPEPEPEKSPPVIRIQTVSKRIAEAKVILNRYESLDTIPADEVYQACNAVESVLRDEPSLLTRDGNFIVVGDLHSNFEALLFVIRRFLAEALNGTQILFLGDYVDKGDEAPGGPQGVKIVTLLFILKVMFPDQVFLLRGNHEDIQQNIMCGFYEECKKKYDGVDVSGTQYVRLNQYFGENDTVTGTKVYDRINSVFNNLSLAAVINGSTFCVHGGISPEIMSDFRLIESISKPLVSFDRGGESPLGRNKLAMDLLWSDPKDDVTKFEFNAPRESGQFFGPSQVDDFLSAHNFKCIFRAHQMATDGYNDVFGDSHIFTLFSAPNYGGAKNQGAMGIINVRSMRFKRFSNTV